MPTVSPVSSDPRREAIEQAQASAAFLEKTQAAQKTGVRKAEIARLAKDGNGQEIAKALRGQNSVIGTMTDAEKRGLVSKSLDTWDNQMKGWDNQDKVRSSLAQSKALVEGVSGDKALSALVKSEFDKKPLNITIFYNNDKTDPSNSFDKAALTYGRGFGANSTVAYMSVQTSSEFTRTWNLLAESGRPVDAVGFFGHGGEDNLYFADGGLASGNIRYLKQVNFTPNGMIDLHACHTAEGVDPVAKAFADTQGVRTVGRNGGATFSTNLGTKTADIAMEDTAAWVHGKGEIKWEGPLQSSWSGHVYLEVYKDGKLPGVLGILGSDPQPLIPPVVFNPPAA